MSATLPMAASPGTVPAPNLVSAVAIPLSSAQIGLLTPAGLSNANSFFSVGTLGTGIPIGGGTPESAASPLGVLPLAQSGAALPRLLAAPTLPINGGAPLSLPTIDSGFAPPVRRVLGDTGLFGTILSPDGGDGGMVSPPASAPAGLPGSAPTGPEVKPRPAGPGTPQDESQQQQSTSFDFSPAAARAWLQQADVQPTPATGQMGSPAAVDRALAEMADESLAATARIAAAL